MLAALLSLRLHDHIYLLRLIVIVGRHEILLVQQVRPLSQRQRESPERCLLHRTALPPPATRQSDRAQRKTLGSRQLHSRPV